MDADQLAVNGTALLRNQPAGGLGHGGRPYIPAQRPGFCGCGYPGNDLYPGPGNTKDRGVDLVLCGEESSDGATGQVPPGIAEWLDSSQLTLLTGVDVNLAQGTARGRRESKGGHELLEVHLPTVISVKTACNEPRFMDYSLRPWALEEQRLTVWDAEDLEADTNLIGLAGSPTIVTGLAEAPYRERRKEYLEGSTEEIVNNLVKVILQEL